MLHTPKISSPHWRKLFEENLCARWKQRKEQYERESKELEEQLLHDGVAENTESRGTNDNDSEASRKQKRKEVESKYEGIAADDDGPLLLPSVCIPCDSQPFSFAGSVLSRMEQQSVLDKARNDRNDAMIEAKFYRNMAEELKQEKREMENDVKARIEVVRDFWRNKIFEGGERAGKTLKISLEKSRSQL